jgi:predicted nucleic acid-binding protein
VVSYFVDTTVLLLAVGGESNERAEARAFLDRARRSRSDIHVSVEAAQEFVFHRLRRVGREVAIADGRDLAASCVCHDFTAAIQARSLDLMEVSGVRGRDAVHAVKALTAGFTEIVTNDRGFDGIPGLRRIDPRDT